MPNSQPFGTTAAATAAVLNAVVENAGMGILLVGDDGVPLRVNPAFCRLLGYSEAELMTMSFIDFTHPDDASLDWDLYSSLRAGARDRYQIDKRYLTRDGAVVWVSLTVSAVRRSDGDLDFVVSLVEDITERRRLQDELRQQALHDYLTGLPNRRLFDDRLAHALRVARRDHQHVAVILVDLDGFKGINDEHGHAAGDEVLSVVASRLVAVCRDVDTVARLGGDEFGVLVGPAESEDVEHLRNRIAATLSGQLQLPAGQTVTVRASIGVASTSGGACLDAESLVQVADRRMYEHKQSTRSSP
jgi:diguanylate cyclase (GGDEF)-like protein/PAS domain S-box-containing protein